MSSALMSYYYVGISVRRKSYLLQSRWYANLKGWVYVPKVKAFPDRHKYVDPLFNWFDSNQFISLLLLFTSKNYMAQMVLFLVTESILPGVVTTLILVGTDRCHVITKPKLPNIKWCLLLIVMIICVVNSWWLTYSKERRSACSPTWCFSAVFAYNQRFRWFKLK